jgi:hypothetical protein
VCASLNTARQAAGLWSKLIVPATSHAQSESSHREAAVWIRRYVNDEIAERASGFGPGSSQFEFVCECGDLSCTARVRATLAEYRASERGSIVGH